MLRSVLLPEPLGPTSATSPPDGMESPIPSSARTLPPKSFTSPSARTAGTAIAGRASVGVDEGANVFPPDRRGDSFRLTAVDDLELADEPRVDEEVGEEFVKGEALERASLQLARADRVDEARVSVVLRVLRIEPIHILHQRHRLGAKALAEDEAAGIGAVRRDGP